MSSKQWAALAATVEADLMARIPENKLRPRLEPTRRAVELLGDPQASYRVIHVTGTNGKTSTTRYIERILREHGLRTGRFTSPHLIRLNERIAIDGEPVSNEQLYLVWQDIKPILEIVDAELEAAGDTKLTFFEALAVLAFAVFADAPVDVLVLEVGMGGTWDSTNVANGDVAVFTPIGLDHMERLGNTVAEIAETKSGIIKAGAMVVSSEQVPAASEVIAEVSGRVADSFKQAGTDFGVIKTEVEGFGQRMSVRGLAGEYQNLFLPVLGEYQAHNVAVAIAAVESFLGGGQQRIMDDVLRVALADSSSPGRLQIIGRDPLLVIDAAHNPHGAQTLAANLQSAFAINDWVGVVGVLDDKDAPGLLRALEPVLQEVVVTKSASPRATSADDLADLAIEIFGEHRVRTTYNVDQALELASEMVGDGVGNAILVTGSITVIGEALALQQAEDLDADYDEADDEREDDDREDDESEVDEFDADGDYASFEPGLDGGNGYEDDYEEDAESDN